MELPKIQVLPDDISLLTPAQMWGKFFLKASDTDKKDFIEELSRANRGIEMAVTVLKNISQDELNWYHESRYWMHVSDERSRLSSAFEEGMEKKAEEDALAFLNEKVPPETIAKCVKLPLEKVLELQKTINAKSE